MLVRKMHQTNVSNGLLEVSFVVICTAECRYNTVQHNMIFHMVWHLYIMTMTEVKYAPGVVFTIDTPYLTLTGEQWGVSFVGIWVKIDRVIMGPLCTWMNSSSNSKLAVLPFICLTVRIIIVKTVYFDLPKPGDAYVSVNWVIVSWGNVLSNCWFR